MTFLKFFDCSGCDKISYYDCNSNNVIKRDGYTYYQEPPSQCIACSENANSQASITARQQRILKTVRVPTGQYLSNLASLTVRGDGSNTPTIATNLVNKSQASDRAILSVQRPIANPRLRPGKLGPGGVGVDVKHNSFERIMARKRAQNIRTDGSTLTPLSGNKTRTYGIVNRRDCECSPHWSLSFF